MIVSRLHLYCDGSDCGRYYPEEGALDGAIYTVQWLRRDARDDRWRRFEEKDYCPKCAAVIAARWKAVAAMKRKARRLGLEAR